MSSDEVWHAYVQSFSFAQLGWLFDEFCKNAKDDMLTGFDLVRSCIGEYLEHEFGGRLLHKDVDDELFKEAAGIAAIPMNFYTFSQVLSRYQSLHLTREDFAGFDAGEVESLQEIFDDHHLDKRLPGLQGKALFALLEDLGIQFTSKEDRQWYVDTVKSLDKDMDGFISFPELCQIIRKVEDMDQEKKRLRMFNLIKSSGLDFAEVEDWFKIFNAQDAEGTGELDRSQMKDLLTTIGLNWTKDVSEIIAQWVTEADENNNGTVDFGEFCIVVSKMWASNLSGVREVSRKFLAKEVLVSFQSVSSNFISVSNSGEVSATSKTLGVDETFTLFRYPSGNIAVKSVHGEYLSVDVDDGIQFKEGKKSELKVKTLEDERVVLSATGYDGGVLYADDKGNVAMSDGNPADRPFFPLSLIFHDDISKKSWSKVKPTQKATRRPSKLRSSSKRSAMKAPAAGLADDDDPGSPGLKAAIKDLDAALLNNTATPR